MVSIGTQGVGVPHWEITDASVAGLDAYDWWDLQWSNPESTFHIPVGDIQLHSNVVTVTTNDNLQNVVDNSPDYTTFRLPGSDGLTVPAYDDPLLIIGRNGMHFVSDDPNNRAMLRHHTIVGREEIAPLRATPWEGFLAPGVHDGYIYNYLVGDIINTARDGYVTSASQDPEGITTFLNQPRDYIFRDIDFRGGDYISWSVAHEKAIYTPVDMLSVRDVLYENCTWHDFKLGDREGDWPGDTSANGRPVAHATIFNIHGGVDGVFLRDCSISCGFEGGVGAVRWYSGMYHDGCYNSAIVNCDFSDQFAYGLLVLVNNDFRMDWNHDGIYQGAGAGIKEQRYAQYVAFVGNTVSNAQYFLTTRGMRHAIIKGNTWNAAGVKEQFLRIESDAISSDIWVEENTVNTTSAVGSNGDGFVHVASGTSNASAIHVLNNSIVGGGTAPNGWLTEETAGTTMTGSTVSGNTP